MRRFSSEIVVGGLLFCVWVLIAQIGCNAITQASDLRVTGEPTGTGSSTSSSSSSSSSSSGSSGDGSTSSSSSSSASSGGSSTSSTSSSSGSTGIPDSGGGGCPKPETDLVAYYPLDEVGGTIVHDCSGNNHDGTVISQHNQMWTTAGRFGNAFSATADAGCIDLGEASALKPEGGNFSVAAWVRVVVFGGGGGNPHYVFGRTALPDSAGWRLGTDVGNAFGTKLYAQTSGLLLVTSTGQHPTNVWTHVAATYAKNGSVALYVNGAAAGSNALTQIVPDNTATLRIGCRGDNDGYFDGAMDEVRLYSRALTSAEIAVLAARVP